MHSLPDNNAGLFKITTGKNRKFYTYTEVLVFSALLASMNSRAFNDSFMRTSFIRLLVELLLEHYPLAFRVAAIKALQNYHSLRMIGVCFKRLH